MEFLDRQPTCRGIRDERYQSWCIRLREGFGDLIRICTEWENKEETGIKFVLRGILLSEKKRSV